MSLFIIVSIDLINKLYLGSRIGVFLNIVSLVLTKGMGIDIHIKINERA